MSNDVGGFIEEEPEEVEKLKKIVFDKKNKLIEIENLKYELLLAYECPICELPLIGYWKTLNTVRATVQQIGYGLRDSGFGAYRFFETDIGQGFEYDPNTDVKKKHAHGVKSYQWASDYDSLWRIFIQQNPEYTVNAFLGLIMNRNLSQTESFVAEHKFIKSVKRALEFISKMRTQKEYFHIIEDICKHGKPIFMFNIAKLEREYRIPTYYSDSTKEIIERNAKVLVDLFGIDFAISLDYAEHQDLQEILLKAKGG